MSREVVKIVIIGHVDHGKSTLIGRLLLDTNSLPKEKIVEIRKISRDLGKETELAFLTDQLKEEREQNITIDTTQIFFKTRRRNYTIIDTPGHVEFIKNMISGTSLAEAAVLIVDVQEGIMEQTRRHAYLINMLGIDKLIVVFNKMDLINYKEERFNELKTKLSDFLDTLRIKASFILPVSAKEGVNISKVSSKTSWHKGPTLLKALDLIKLDKKNTKKPLRFPVQDVYEVDGKKVIVGRLVSGVLKQSQEIVLFPSAKRARINFVRAFGQHRTKAKAGESIGLALKDHLDVKRGDLLVQKEDTPKPREQFRSSIFWMSHEPLQINKKMTLRCATQEVECVAKKIEKRINSSTLKIIEEDAKELNLNETGEVILKTEKPVVIEKFNFIEELGRFVLEHKYNLQGMGIIM